MREHVYCEEPVQEAPFPTMQITYLDLFSKAHSFAVIIYTLGEKTPQTTLNSLGFDTISSEARKGCIHTLAAVMVSYQIIS